VDIKANQQDKYEFVMNIASGKMRFEEIASWLEKHSE
jgi:prophage maintenance system killer protein